MKVVALAGGVGAGKFLRGLVRIVPPEDVTVIVNTGDDVEVHGLHVSPDLDSVTYWLAGVADRDRGWGRAGETFRATDELRRMEAEFGDTGFPQVRPEEWREIDREVHAMGDGQWCLHRRARFRAVPAIRRAR